MNALYLKETNNLPSRKKNEKFQLEGYLHVRYTKHSHANKREDLLQPKVHT